MAVDKSNRTQAKSCKYYRRKTSSLLLHTSPVPWQEDVLRGKKSFGPASFLQDLPMKGFRTLSNMLGIFLVCLELQNLTEFMLIQKTISPEIFFSGWLRSYSMGSGPQCSFDVDVPNALMQMETETCFKVRNKNKDSKYS